MGRAPCCDKVGLKRGRWTTEEDEILLNYIKANGEGSWRAMPKNAGLLRCGKSCRLRWINYLRADLKRGNILKEEEETIIKLHATMGNRWSLIASHLPGRTDNEIKNYWNSHLSRRVDSFIRTNEKDTTPMTGDVGKLASVGKRRGGRTSRSAMKKTCLYAKSIRRENEGKSGSNIPTSSSVQSAEGSNMLLDCIRRENEGKSGSNIPTSSSVQSAEGSSMLLDFGLDEGLLGFGQEIGEMLLSPTSQLVESRIWEDVECEELFGASEERERGVMSSSEEREGGGLVEKEGGVMSLKEERGGADMVREMVEWDLEGLKEKLWDDEGYMWPWVWDNGRGDLDFQSVEGSGYNEEMTDTWLVSDL